MMDYTCAAMVSTAMMDTAADSNDAAPSSPAHTEKMIIPPWAAIALGLSLAILCLFLPDEKKDQAETSV